MRFVVLVAGSALALPAAASAQHPDSSAARPAADITQEATRRFNAPAVLRLSGVAEIGKDSVVAGDVTVVDGKLTLAGRIAGRVTAVNAEVVLLPTCHIGGDLLIVGGAVHGAAPGFVGGDIEVSAERVYTKQRGDSLIVERGLGDDQRWLGRIYGPAARSSAQFALGTFGTYSRVEGLPVYLGPALRYNADWGSATLKVYAVLRTAGSGSNGENRGHSVAGELRFGRGPGFAIGGRLFDVVDPVEEWQLRDVEASLASFLLHRDYRDYYNRHGGSARIVVIPSPQIDLALSLSDERWRSRAAGDPFTLFTTGAEWRPNPPVDEGRVHVANMTLRLDTRNDQLDPWSGFLVTADYERGSGMARPGIDSRVAPPGLGLPPLTPQPIGYNRVFVDFRRYTRIAKNGQVNVRAAFGGQLAGGDLPLERRFSVGGAGTLPGFDFRDPSNGEATACAAAATIPGRPATCQRFALAQAEYRGDLLVSLFGAEEGGQLRRQAHRHFRYRSDAVWVLFVDAGRGWLLGARDSSEARYPLGAVPPLATFRTDVGAGLDFDELGFYLAQPLNGSRQRVHFLVRVRHRF